ncbi:MAG: DNA polymerase III subunit beta [Acutalibacteraceae bacterium]|nr:DNA polymerase III subunit beta [Acutalibacteraceae bacterium]
MNFTVDRNVILDAVSHLSRIVSNKTSYPVLEGILISAEQGKVTLIAYNLEMSMKKEIYARTQEDGDIVISARILSDIFKRLSGPMVQISADDKLICHISCSGAVFDIPGMAAIDYPEIPNFFDGQEISLKGSTLMEMTEGTSFAVAPVEGTRPVLMGINISCTDSVLQFVAIDGYRLAIRKTQIEGNDEFNFTISGLMLNEVVRLISDKEELIPISIGSKMISFVIDGYKIICRLIEGEFVNYQRTIPAAHKQKIVVMVRDLLGILDRISLLISDSFSTPVRCIVGEESINFSCSTSAGKVTELYEVDLEGEPFEIGLSSRYLIEALKAVDDDMVQIKFDSSKQGVVIEPLQSDDYMYMIMPMRLK